MYVTYRQKGFTIVELLIYIAMFGMVLTAMYGLLITNSRSYSSQENRVEMTQDLRAAMNIMAREIRTAGCDPTDAGDIGFVDDGDDRYDTDDNSIHFTMDLDEDGSIGASEDINYYLYVSDGIQKIGRRTGSVGSPSPVAENITAMTFLYQFADGEQGVPDETDVDTTNDLADIRSVQITIAAQTAKVDPISLETKSHTQSTWVKVRNAGL